MHADSRSLGASLNADSRGLGASLHADSRSLGASLHADSYFRIYFNQDEIDTNTLHDLADLTVD